MLVGDLPDELKRDAVMGAVRDHFKPEFLNRLDDIVVFDALSTEDLTRIVDIQVAALAERLAARRLTLEVTEAAREWLALNGFDPLYGARPLRRLVQTAIGDALARELAQRADPRRADRARGCACRPVRAGCHGRLNGGAERPRRVLIRHDESAGWS